MFDGLKSAAKRLVNRLSRSFGDELQMEFGSSFRSSEAVAQKVLMQQYRLLAARGKEQLPSFDDVGFRSFSEFEEDGILLYLFSLLRPANRVCVEICAGNGRQCMTTNLIVNHGWWGYLFDGSERNVLEGRRFFSNNKDTFLHPPSFNHAWITAENVNEQLTLAGVSGAVDLLSLDIDGMDYWVWNAINVIEPTVVVCETHNVIPAGRALTVPYDPAFVGSSEHYRGASLEAMCQLGKQKGYRLVGVHRFGFNAFFVKNGVGDDFFPGVAARECVGDPFSQRRRKDWPQVESMPWREVG
jgi:hypothetical protein